MFPGRITKQGLVNQHATMDQTRELFNPKCCHLSFTNFLKLGVSINVLLCYPLTGLDCYSNAITVTERVAELHLKSNGLYIAVISNKTRYQHQCGGICHLLYVFLLHYCLKNNSVVVQAVKTTLRHPSCATLDRPNIFMPKAWQDSSKYWANVLPVSESACLCVYLMSVCMPG